MLPEVFGVNAWVRSVADRLAAKGYPALAVPLFARTAPDLELAYKTSDLAQGRRHKEATTADQILADVAAALTWFQACHPQVAIHVVGFCFGGHAAFLAATLPGVEKVFDFYGAGLVQMRPGGGQPSLNLLPEVQAQLTCVFGTADPLIPIEDREAIREALRNADPAGQRLRFVEYAGADHGFMCEARSSFDPQASAQGWRLLLGEAPLV
ncbi:dienelactone hydrolase family protein [Synechococcus sp. MU1642]|uniref:dienelactone hydrolase family protein n=1 Tax=Synechococcus sp. MU1642 TaxID=2508348 RepID=UPI00351D3989